MTEIPIAHPGHLIVNQARPTWLPDCYKPKYRPNSNSAESMTRSCGIGYLWDRAKNNLTDIHICTGLQYNKEANYLHEYSDNVKNNKEYYALYGAGINFKDIEIKESLITTLNNVTEFKLIEQLNKLTLRPAQRTFTNNNKKKSYELVTLPYDSVDIIGMNYWEYHIALYIDDPELKMSRYYASVQYTPVYSNLNLDVYMQFRIPLYKEPKETIVTDSILNNTGNYDTQIRSNWRKLPWVLNDLYNMSSNPG